MDSSSLVAEWAGLGITFQVDKPVYTAPEEVILQTIRYGDFPKDRKFFGLMLLWLQEYSAYLHVERLKRMIEGLPSHELALLGGICLKIRIRNKDRRFDAVLNKIREQLELYGPPAFESLVDHPFFIKRHGLDTEFASFGIKVAQLMAAPRKKIRSEMSILSQHLWLRHRCLFGVNFRADVATIMRLYHPPNGYQAAKLAGCSINAGYRHWGDLMKLGWSAQGS